ncbi:hypothetical protein CKO19_17130, partial [Rhodovulum adriaticum]|nr:hypothetical protein [Rhodovulum adriaticum]
MDEFEIDGWRFDVANELDHTFVREINKSIKSKYPDFYLLAEMWHDPSGWISYDQFDANMEYEISNIFVNLVNKKIDIDQAINILMEIQFRTPINHFDSQFHLVSSHDTERLLNMVNFDIDNAFIVLFALAIQKGSICIFYGDEYLLEGGKDPLCRACLPIEITENQVNLKNRFK